MLVQFSKLIQLNTGLIWYRTIWNTLIPNFRGDDPRDDDSLYICSFSVATLVIRLQSVHFTFIKIYSQLICATLPRNKSTRRHPKLIIQLTVSFRFYFLCTSVFFNPLFSFTNRSIKLWFLQNGFLFCKSWSWRNARGLGYFYPEKGRTWYFKIDDAIVKFIWDYFIYRIDWFWI